MYADQVAAGAKRSIKDRLDGNHEEDFGRSRSTANGKRQRQTDDRWKHDLFEDNEPRVSKPKLDTKDLRAMLQRKSTQPANHAKASGIQDVRGKLPAITQSQTKINDPPKAKPIQEACTTTKKSVQPVEAPAAETKKAADPLKKKSQRKTVSTVDGLLRSLGLEKYLITFQAEEVDMDALVHMTEVDFKDMGIPMGPRKKMLSALGSRS